MQSYVKILCGWYTNVLQHTIMTTHAVTLTVNPVALVFFVAKEAAMRLQCGFDTKPYRCFAESDPVKISPHLLLLNCGRWMVILLSLIPVRSIPLSQDFVAVGSGSLDPVKCFY